MMLVDYDDSDCEQDKQLIQKETVKELAQAPKKNVKIAFNDLLAISKKVKSNDYKPVTLPQPQKLDDDDIWNPNDYQKGTLTEDPQVLEVKKGKYDMSLSKPKFNGGLFYGNSRQSLVPMKLKRKLPPPPPGMSFAVADELSKTLLRNDDENQQKEVDEFDGDDMFIRDLEKMKAAGIHKFTSEETIKQLESKEMMEINADDLLDLDWQADQAKKKQAQEVYMRVQLADPTNLQKDKNHISSLLKIAAEKEEEFDQRKQEQRFQIQKAKSKYGW